MEGKVFFNFQLLFFLKKDLFYLLLYFIIYSITLKCPISDISEKYENKIGYQIGSR